MFRRTMLCSLVAAALALLLAGAAYAHLTGAFANYLGAIYSEETNAKLKQELKETEQQINELLPRLNEMETAYTDAREIAAEKLLFYNEQGVDMWAGMLLQAEDMVDILGNQWVMERQLAEYISELDELYYAHTQLADTKAGLDDKQQLLQAIEDNLSRRQSFLDSVRELSIEEKANFLDIDWASEVEDYLVLALEQSNARVADGWQNWIETTLLDDSPAMYQEWLNAGSELRYFFRKDHIYVVFERKTNHVILIGQVLTNDEGSAELSFEAGFYNSFFMPGPLFDELKGFEIPYEEFRALPGMTDSAYLKQEDGRLLIMPQR